MTAATNWQRLCELLDGDPAVWDGVHAALVSAGEQAPWEALLDGLDDAGALAYLQSDDTGMELADALAQLPRVVRAGLELGEVTDTDDLGAATMLADEVLRSAGLRLVRLVEEGDAWPIVVVEEESATEAASIADRLGHEVVQGG